MLQCVRWIFKNRIKVNKLEFVYIPSAEAFLQAGNSSILLSKMQPGRVDELVLSNRKERASKLHGQFQAIPIGYVEFSVLRILGFLPSAPVCMACRTVMLVTGKVSALLLAF